MNEIVVSSDKRFSRAILGLNKTEVYAYLNQISGAYEELQLQIDVLKDQNNKLSDSNRENALKLYNLQNDITEAQRKTDLANAEAESAKKEAAALRKELEAAQKRITKLTDELIKANAGEGDGKAVSEVTGMDSASETVTAESGTGFTPKPIFETVEPEKKSGPKDIFEELRNIAAQEKKQAEPVKPEPEHNPVSSADNIKEDEVYSGEVEVKVDESMLIGNEDDEDEGFNFL